MFTVAGDIEADDDNVRVSSDDPLEALLGSDLMRLGALMAVDRDGRLQGIVTWDQVRRALQQPTAARRADAASPIHPMHRIPRRARRMTSSS